MTLEYHTIKPITFVCMSYNIYIHRCFCFLFSLQFLFFPIQIFPYEIDNIFRTHPGIVHSSTVGVNHRGGGQVPHCFVICNNEDKLTEYMLRQTLSSKYTLNSNFTSRPRHYNTLSIE